MATCPRLFRLISTEVMAYCHRMGSRAASGALLGALGGVAAGAAAALFIVAAVRPPPLGFGPRVKLRLAGSPAVRFAGWILGLMIGAGAIPLLLLSLQKNGRMPPPLKALNTGLWAPPVMLSA